MNIEEQFKKTKDWADEKQILFVEGNFEEKKLSIVEIENKEENSIETFTRIPTGREAPVGF